jgi:hypothetical protein
VVHRAKEKAKEKRSASAKGDRAIARKLSIMPEGRYARPVHMIKLTETRQLTPYKFAHPDDDDRS